jgi:hypothetical protein
VLTVTRSEKQIEVHVTTERRPLIYLDQCALYEVCKHNAVGVRFKHFFKNRGELLLSSINLFELGQLQGDSLTRTKAFLDETIGLAWIPIEFDCTLMIVRELAGKVSPSPAICDRLLEDVCASTGEPTISKLLDAARHSDQDRAKFDNAKEELKRQINELRDEFIKDVSILDRKYPKIPVTSGSKTLSVAALVFRLIVERARGGLHFQWTVNDAEDFTHAITGLAHADVVVLDGKWADRVRGLTPASVFSCGQMDAFLDWCESTTLDQP